MRCSGYGNGGRMHAILNGSVFVMTALPCSGGYHLGRGGMPLHGINSKNGATTENQGADVKYMG